MPRAKRLSPKAKRSPKRVPKKSPKKVRFARTRPSPKPATRLPSIHDPGYAKYRARQAKLLGEED
jgi:hypothetical protein